MRPGGTTPDRGLRTPTTPRRLTKTTKRVAKLERRPVPASGTEGVGDWVEAEAVGTGTRQTLPNNAQTVILFNNTGGGGRAGGAGTVTIDSDEKTFKGTKGGHVRISCFTVIEGDYVGMRGISLVNTVNNLDDAEQIGTNFPTGDLSGTSLGPQGTLTWDGVFDDNWSFQIAANVQGASGDQDLNFAQCTVSLVAPLGS